MRLLAIADWLGLAVSTCERIHALYGIYVMPSGAARWRRRSPVICAIQRVVAMSRSWLPGSAPLCAAAVIVFISFV